MTKDKDQIKHIQDIHWDEDKHARRKPDHKVVCATFEPLAEIVAGTIGNPHDSSVLDVGCGNGYLQWALEKRFKSVVGIDYSQKMLAVNPCREKHLGSCTDLPYPDRSFDVVVASHLLHHLNEPDRIKTLTEMKRVARLAVISFEPNRVNPLMFLFSLIKQEERMALEFSSNYMRSLFVTAGLIPANIHVEGWIVPNKAPVWWIPLGKFLGKTPLKKLGFDICSVFKINPTNNALPTNN